MITETKTLKELTYEWFDKVWNNCQEECIHELMSENCVVKGLPLTDLGPTGFIPFYRAYQQAFDNLKMDIFEIMEEGEYCMGHATFTGTHKATGVAVNAEFSFSGKWQNSQLIEARNIVDFTSLLSQLKIFNIDDMAKIFN